VNPQNTRDASKKTPKKKVSGKSPPRRHRYQQVAKPSIEPLRIREKEENQLYCPPTCIDLNAPNHTNKNYFGINSSSCIREKSTFELNRRFRRVMTKTSLQLISLRKTTPKIMIFEPLVLRRIDEFFNSFFTDG